jgi:AraC family transcriptional regulator
MPPTPVDRSYSSFGATNAVLGHGADKFPIGQLAGSSTGRNWLGIAAERWSHPAGDLPAFVPVFTEVAVLIRGRSTVTREAAGIRQRTKAVPGTVWLCPAGLREHYITVSDDIAEVLHIYLPPRPFIALTKAHGSRSFSDVSLLYEAGFRDPLLEAIAGTIQSEMQAETSTGRFLVESLASTLAARLLQRHSDITIDLPPPAERGLDHRRLQRVLEYVETHLRSDISVEDLASTAALSRFHFARAFKAATGKTPRQHIGERRLTLAKSLLSKNAESLTQIAFACRFSSTANFSRAFRRSTGVAPGVYRTVTAANTKRQIVN